MQDIRIVDIQETIEKVAPLNTQEEWDNSGLQIGNPDESVKSIMLCLDLTKEIVDEALLKECNLIICHHPFIFNPIKSINMKQTKGQIIKKLIKNDIAVYAAHTSIDNTKEIGYKLMNKLDVNGKTEVKDFCAVKAALVQASTFDDFVKLVGNVTEDTNIRSIGNTEAIIKQVFFANGAGGSDVNLVNKAKADNAVLITSEIKYNVALFAKEIGVNVIEIGHYESEKVFIDVIFEIINQKHKNLKVIKSSKCKSPYNPKESQ